MAIDIGNWLNTSCKWLSKAFSNPLLTAIIIATLIFIMSMVILPTQKDIPVSRLMKFALYVFGVTALGIFLHSSSVESRVKETYQNKSDKQEINKLDNFVREGDTDIGKALNIAIAPRGTYQSAQSAYSNPVSVPVSDL